MADEGKYTDLPGNVTQVVVRFPPEASGYLHIGHAKAALLNQRYQLANNGKLVFRFDDTNPEKEKEDFEQVIREDVQLLQVQPDICSHTSDHFEVMLEKCETLIKNGKAFVDDTPADVMKNERETRTESKNRNKSVEDNLRLWNEMKKGSDIGKKCCVRAKIDMNSNNGCMRDPTIYRCKEMAHPKTGNKYKVYPTYDFACPIVDSLEGVTHALRTTEYEDRDEQFAWFIKAMGLREVYIVSYARLNMMNTVLSKRKLTWFVDEGLVDGWDDPRMPTVRGVLRHGLTVEGLKQFIVAQGSSRSVVFMDWDKIWSFNRKILDGECIRLMGIEEKDAVTLNLDCNDGTIEMPAHPKRSDLPALKVAIGPKILIEQIDCQQMKEGDKVTMMGWGNMIVKKIVKDDKGKVISIDGKLALGDKDFKKTLKIAWLKAETAVKAKFIYYEHLLIKSCLGKDDDFKDFINRDNVKMVDFLVSDTFVSEQKKGRIFQFLKRGYFIVDSEYDPKTIPHIGMAKPAHLISVPDGTTDLNIFPLGIQEWKKKIRDEIIKLSQDVPKGKTKKGESSKKEGDNTQQPHMNYDDIDPSSELGLVVQALKVVGDNVRLLKASKADVRIIQENVKILLLMKERFKKLTGKDYVAPPQPKVESQPKQSKPTPKDRSSAVSGDDKENEIAKLSEGIKTVGDNVRQLKSDKADKKVIQENVAILLDLKARYKGLTGSEWVPQPANHVAPSPTSTTTSTTTTPTPPNDAVKLSGQIKEIGDKIRQLKSDKADKKVIQENVNILLELKSKYKTLTGNDWTASCAVPETVGTNVTSNGSSTNESEKLNEEIKKVGDSIRQLKADKADKQKIADSVKCLLELKSKYKEVTGSDWVPSPAAQSSAPVPKPKTDEKKKDEKKKDDKRKDDKKKAKSVEKEEKESGTKKQSRLGIEFAKSVNLADWYTEVITKSEMIEYYDVSGCYILRPWSYAIWEVIQKFLDNGIKSLGVENCYFPMFVSQSALEKEKTHIEDFAPEVAWVTKSGQSDLAEPIAIRPTSETVMYPSFAKWCQSHRSLPIKVNQWCNIVRWEFKNPTPFMRTREFLWQEGHTAYAEKEEAVKEVHEVLDLYASVYEHLLAVPVIKGRKSEKEKFAGGDFTTTIEGYIGANGRGIQAATSHHLGQNFSKMFDITFEDPNKAGTKRHAYQNSWGLTTRSIGVMIMVHSDDKGLVLPPNVAPYQVVIVPCGITATTSEQEKAHLIGECKKLHCSLISSGIRSKCDLGEHNSPGWKFNHWELKGVPIRIELGPKDLGKGEFVAVRRDTGAKETNKLEGGSESIGKLLNTIQSDLFERARKNRDDHLVVVKEWESFLKKLDDKYILLAPFCGAPVCEETIKKNSVKQDQSDASGPLMGAKSLCIPFDQPSKIDDTMKCINPHCKGKPQFFTLFGRSY